MMEEQQQAFGAKDLWAEGGLMVEGRGGGWVIPQRSKSLWERSLIKPSDEGDGQPRIGETSIGGMCASLVAVRGNTPPTYLRLSPAGGKHHGRWVGGGQETGVA